MKLKGVAPCSVEGCPNLYYGRGWCSAHYMRWYRTGDPLGSTLRKPADRFAEFINRSGSCWLWTGAISDTGYGNFWLNGGTVLAHRYSYETAIGAVPEGLQLDHLCRIRACVNPAHLEPVTASENTKRQPVNAGRFGSATTEQEAAR